MATEAQIANALEGFAARNGQSLASVLTLLSNNGVAVESLRDLVTANFAWQTFIRQSQAASLSVTDSDIDAALAATGESTNLRVLVSEIVLPLIEGQEDEIRKLARDISQLRSQEDFESAARQFSVAGSRAEGGKLDWIPLSNLPQALRPVILPLAVGQVSEPLELPNAIALFQMRGLSESSPTSGSVSNVEYAMATVAGDAMSELAAIAGKATRCDDLYGLTAGFDGVTVELRTQFPNDVPRRESLWLARLDAGETLVDSSTDAQGNQQTNLVMLCNRTSASNANASRDEVRIRLLNEKLNTRANSLLESLKASARIEYK